MIVAKSFTFCAGHRLRLHESKCRHMHGHNWTVKVAVESDELDECGRVVDFSEIKRLVKGWVDANLDHGFIVERADGDVLTLLLDLDGQKLFVMDSPPTAENLAKLIRGVAVGLLRTERVTVTVSETDTSEAICTP